MAQLGAKTLDELIGRADLLQTNDAILTWKAKGLDFSKLFYVPENIDQESRKHISLRTMRSQSSRQ